MYSERIVAKKIQELMAEIGAGLESPQVVADIDKAITMLTNMREVAIGLHGVPVKSQFVPISQAADDAGDLYKPLINNNITDIASIKDRYCVDKSFLKLHYKSRKQYWILLKQIVDQWGDKPISEIKSKDVEAIHKQWGDERGPAMAHALIGMLRTLIYFGSTELHNSECERLSVVLHRMKFSAPKSTVAPLTAEQASAIREQAHKMERPSLALAQAFQFDCNFSQKDVIGEWVPLKEQGDEYLVFAGTKWLRGIRWEEIDDHLILKHMAGKSLTEAIVDLKDAPMVVEELKRQYGSMSRNKLPERGPVIISELSNIPYLTDEFRKTWRRAANLVGLPTTIRNGSSKSSSRPSKKDTKATKEALVDLSLELEQQTLRH